MISSHYTCSKRFFFHNIIRNISTATSKTKEKALSIKETIRKPWTVQESKKLIELVKIYGKKWKTISPHFSDRNEAALSGRFNYIAQRSTGEMYCCLDKDKGKLPWSNQDDELLLSLCQEHGLKWTKLTPFFKHRNSNGLMQRYFRLKAREMPDIKLGRWSKSDSDKLLELIKRYGTDWVRITAEMKTRTMIQCRSRHRYICLQNTHIGQPIVKAKLDNTSFFDSRKYYKLDLNPNIIETRDWKHEEILEMNQLYHELGSMELVQHRLSVKRGLKDMWKHYYAHDDENK